MKHTLSLLFILAALWWILSGYSKPLLLSLGAFSVVFAVFITRRMEILDRESHPVHLSLQLMRYWMYLLWQILRANLSMTATILGPRSAVHPRVITVATRQNSELSRAVLGNSITLTPGTVTIDIRENLFEVHALNAANAAGVESGAMDRRVPGNIEGEA